MSIPKKLVLTVLERDRFVCQLACSTACLVEATVADHRANRGHGGSKILNDAAALVAACGICNGAKEDAHSLILLELETRGLSLLKDSTNAKTLQRCRETPMQDIEGAWWFLLSDGRREPVGEVPF